MLEKRNYNRQETKNLKSEKQYDLPKSKRDFPFPDVPIHLVGYNGKIIFLY